MEKATYRDNLECILEKSGGKLILSPPEAAKVTGLSARSVMKYFGKYFNSMGNRQYISAADLARAISK